MTKTGNSPSASGCVVGELMQQMPCRAERHRRRRLCDVLPHNSAIQNMRGWCLSCWWLGDKDVWCSSPMQRPLKHICTKEGWCCRRHGVVRPPMAMEARARLMTYNIVNRQGGKDRCNAWKRGSGRPSRHESAGMATLENAHQDLRFEKDH